MTSAVMNDSVRIRSIGPADRDALATFYGSLSEESLEARFGGATSRIGNSAARFFCGPDHLHREGIVAETVDASGRPVIIGHLCLEPIGPDMAEMAIAVADAWQRHGVGRAMLDEAVAWGRRHGIARLSAFMRSSNSAILGLVRSIGYPVTFGTADAGTIEVLIDTLPDVA